MFKNLFKKEKWEMVGVFNWPIYKTKKGIKESGKTYYHLFESNKGNRRFEFSDTFGDPEYLIRPLATSSEIYLQKIYPWLQGRNDPEIPRYSEIPEEDTANYLKGKK